MTEDKTMTEAIEKVWYAGFNQGISNAIAVLGLYKGVSEEIDMAIEKIIIGVTRLAKSS